MTVIALIIPFESLLNEEVFVKFDMPGDFYKRILLFLV
jgi:hypothetical protein